MTVFKLAVTVVVTILGTFALVELLREARFMHGMDNPLALRARLPHLVRTVATFEGALGFSMILQGWRAAGGAAVCLTLSFFMFLYARFQSLVNAMSQPD